MAENRDFTCRACGAQFDTQDKLDKHNSREHSLHGMRSGQPGESGTQRSSQAGSTGSTGQVSEGGNEQVFGNSPDEPGSSAQRDPDGSRDEDR
ncbi:MAG TPA: hypothetical protein VJ717_03230 [Gemmatimonadaceae bacterium]|nr:hypothetical protein [Gemmatimonadaceae bacterium]